jgi:hypothetical protein
MVLAQHRQFFAVHGFGAAPFQQGVTVMVHGQPQDKCGYGTACRCSSYTVTAVCTSVHTRALELAVYAVYYTCLASSLFTFRLGSVTEADRAGTADSTKLVTVIQDGSASFSLTRRPATRASVGLGWRGSPGASQDNSDTFETRSYGHFSPELDCMAKKSNILLRSLVHPASTASALRVAPARPILALAGCASRAHCAAPLASERYCRSTSEGRSRASRVTVW